MKPAMGHFVVLLLMICVEVEIVMTGFDEQLEEIVWELLMLVANIYQMDSLDMDDEMVPLMRRKMEMMYGLTVH